MEEQSRKMQEQIDKQNKEWAEKEQKKWEEQQKRRKEEEERERKEWEEQERKRKEEEDIIKNPNRVRIDILAALNKEKVKKIVKACPKRTSLSLNQFRDHFKKVTSNLTEEEKAYALF